MVHGISIWFIVALLVGVIACVVAYIKGEFKGSTAWFLVALWIIELKTLI